MTAIEVRDVANELKAWAGAQLQEIVVDGVRGEEPRSIRLGFFWTGGLRWVVFDYDVRSPWVLLFDGREGGPRTPPKTAGKVRRPIELFLRSKHVGRRLREVRLSLESDRTFVLVFDSNEDESDVVIEFRVFPHGRNVRAVSGAQAVSEFKMPTSKQASKQTSKQVEEPQSGEGLFDSQIRLPPRTQAELVALWMDLHAKPRQGSRAVAEAKTSATREMSESPEIKKKRRALEKVKEEIRLKAESPARAVADWITANQSLRVPDEPGWRELIDETKGLAGNIQKLYGVAKAHERKLAGTRERAAILEKEIEKLEERAARGPEYGGDRVENATISGGKAGVSDLFQVAAARGRKFQVADDLILYLGKNGAENLAILRKAQPFDYWLHLREYPGAHAILRRARGRVVSDADLLKAGAYVAEQTMKRRAIDLKGEAFDLLIVECRYVRPIKGDRLGRVHYTNDRVLRLKF
ncbi:MAG: hypothetical protein RBT63_10580 [Bdellovibrionales bacterium]|jgi:predicted ribosome quality control (RQC) complex YloA/Tae2 family protein|nr:hypothetical protein [Bdellovibrionales bacterium]